MQKLIGLVRLAVLFAFLWFVSAVPARADQTAIETLVLECASCTEKDMRAVAEVIRNRAANRGQTVKEVCLAKWQFSGWNDKERAKKFIKSQPDWVTARARSAWEASANGSLVGSADHYFADYIRKPSWARSMRFCGQFGRHMFYQSKGGR